VSWTCDYNGRMWRKKGAHPLTEKKAGPDMLGHGGEGRTYCGPAPAKAEKNWEKIGKRGGLGNERKTLTEKEDI